MAHKVPAVATGAMTLEQSRALGDATRTHIMEILTQAETPLGVRELATRLRLHPNAVRYHLARLREASLIAESAAASGARGRPRLTYRVVPVHDVSPRYERLAVLLAAAVRSKRTARATGRLSGQEAADVYKAKGIDTRPAIEDQARQLGFEPRWHGPDLVLNHCPYANVAVDNPETICQLHLGLAEGLARRLGGVVVEGMTIRDPYRAGCRLRLVDRM